MVLCVGLNIADTSCLPGPSSTLNVPFGNGRSTAILLTLMNVASRTLPETNLL